MAVVLGAILVVTGPTVIMPLLRQAKLNKQSASLLKWEGIVNDPVGVLLAVLTFQYFTTGGGWERTAAGVGAAIGAAAVLGGAGGWLTGWLFQRGAVPEHLKAPILMVQVLVVYWASNLVQHEAGLLSVTVMGLVVGNMKLVDREALQRFKENLTVVLLSVLFIVIPSQLHPDQLAMLDWRIAAFVAVTLLLVRPLTIAVATLGSPMRREDKILLAWIAPRGIVAAATAGIFGPALVAAGHADAEKLLPITFGVIIATVLAHGLSIGWLARRLNLAAKGANGLLIVGASPWTAALARALQALQIDVMLVDGSYWRLKDVRMAGIDVYCGEILSDHAEHMMETQHLSHLLCATDNDFYNALVCKAQGRHFGLHRTFQLATLRAEGPELKRLTLQQRGHFAFDRSANHAALHERLRDGWAVQSTRLSPSYGFSELRNRLGEPGSGWLLLGGVSPSGMFRLYSDEQRFKLEAGWTVIFFAPEQPAPGGAEVPAPAGASARASENGG